MTAHVTAFKMNDSGLRAFLTSAPVRNDMLARGRRIQIAAGGAPDFALYDGTSDRAIAAVVTATHQGRQAEATHRALTRAIDAGRD
jgi:hypothetical protein